MRTTFGFLALGVVAVHGFGATTFEFAELGSMLSPDGVLFAAGDADYTEHLMEAYFHKADADPAVLVVPATVGDVQAAVRYATQYGLDLGVLGGGHAYGGPSGTEGVMIDIGGLNEVTVAEDGETVTFDLGAKIDDIDSAVEAAGHGKFPVNGNCPIIGMGSFLHGGYGSLNKKAGLGIDNAVEYKVVLASGELVTANADENEDLFWALRGAGSSFGVVVEATVKTIDVSDYFGGVVVLPNSGFPGLVEVANKFNGPLFHIRFTIMTLPPPASVSTEITLWGSEKEWEEHGGKQAVLNEFFALEEADPIPLPTYFAQQQFLGPGLKFAPLGFESFGVVGAFTFKDIPAAIAGMLAEVPAGFSVFIHSYGGAFSDVAPDATPFHGRDITWDFSISSSWPVGTPGAENIPFGVAAYLEELKLLADGNAASGIYVNWATPSGEVVADAYGENIDRLLKIKAQYDPENVFHNTYDLGLAM